MLTATPVIIYGREIQPLVGSYVIKDDKSIGELLLAGDEPVDESYIGCQFRWPVSPRGPIKSIACNVVVTGRTLQRKSGGYYVRVRLEWVGDGEASSFSNGWMRVD